MRLESENEFNEDPPRLPSDNLYERIRNIIEKRVDEIDDQELNATLDMMEYIMQCWEDWNPKLWEPAKNPDFSYADPLPLMFAAGTHRNDAWGDQRALKTPMSMRNVDASCEAIVLQQRYTPKEG